MNFSLVLGELAQQVTVNAATAAIDSTTSTVSGVVPEERLTELPLAGRDLFRAAIFEPGVAAAPSSGPSFLSSGKGGQVSINGMRPSWTVLMIDGMDAREPVCGYSPSGASGLFLGLNEMSEVRILTQTFDVEYGGVGAGVIVAVTKSGSNHFHGSLFEFYRGASLDAKNYFDLGNRPIPQLVRN
jgi:outer membrane receptor for ferrienterochelin and colicin